MSGRNGFVWCDGHWMPRAIWLARHTAPAAPAVHSDFSGPVMCHADGKLHGSRSTYDAAMRANGCEVVGKTEMRRMQEAGPFRGPVSNMEPVAQTLRRFANEG